ncbi:uncharacterized protein LOC108677576 [Hyalella azteca]|uniref:Uncharacterized protein LOC108677576 n=1 Tax=Hyalella azteca TaxID=294128 RepID=A0A8B7P5V6_HYAAZ|nr:uncharacterized protein LOC108677576 [Hyalella azteca]
MENNHPPPPPSASTPSQSYNPSGDLVSSHNSSNNINLRNDLQGLRADPHTDLRHDPASKSYLNIGVIPPAHNLSAFPDQLRHPDHYRSVYSNLHHSLQTGLHQSLHGGLHPSLASGLSSIGTSAPPTSTTCTINGDNPAPLSNSIGSLSLGSLSIPSSSPNLHLGGLNSSTNSGLNLNSLNTSSSSSLHLGSLNAAGLGVNTSMHSFAPVSSSLGLPLSSSSGLSSAGSSSAPIPGPSISPSMPNFGLAGLKLEGGGSVSGVSDLTINGNERCSSVGAALDHSSASRGLGVQGLSDLSGIGLGGIGHMGSFGSGLGPHGHATPRPSSVGALNQLGQPRLKRNGELYKTKNYVYNRALYEQKMANESPEQRAKRLEYARQRYYRLKHTMSPEELARRNMRAKERYYRLKHTMCASGFNTPKWTGRTCLSPTKNRLGGNME